MSNIDYLQSDNSETRGGPTLGEFLNNDRFDVQGFRSLSPAQIDVAISSRFGLDVGLFGEYSEKPIQGNLLWRRLLSLVHVYYDSSTKPAGAYQGNKSGCSGLSIFFG